VLLQLAIGKKVSIVTLDRSYGLYVGLVLAAALAYGGFLVAKERGDFPATRGTGGAPSGPSI
jgi:hypothetical protein